MESLCQNHVVFMRVALKTVLGDNYLYCDNMDIFSYSTKQFYVGDCILDIFLNVHLSGCGHRHGLKD